MFESSWTIVLQQKETNEPLKVYMYNNTMALQCINIF